MWRERLKKLLKQNPLKKYLKESLVFSLVLTFFLILLPKSLIMIEFDLTTLTK